MANPRAVTQGLPAPDWAVAGGGIRAGEGGGAVWCPSTPHTSNASASLRSPPGLVPGSNGMPGTSGPPLCDGLGGAPPPGAILKLAAAGYFVNEASFTPCIAWPPGPREIQMPHPLTAQAHSHSSTGDWCSTASGEVEGSVDGAKDRDHYQAGTSSSTLQTSSLSTPSPAKAETLQRHLSQLQYENPELVFIVRGIAKMGFRSRDLLEAHYSKYDSVSRVMVVNSKVPSKVKSYTGGTQQGRIRPGSLGFVVMGTTQSVARIMAEGSEQTVSGYQIRVERFSPFSISDNHPVTPPLTVVAEERSNSKPASGSHTPTLSTCNMPAGSEEEHSQSTGQVAEDPISSDSALQKIGTSDPSTSDTAFTLADLRIDAMRGTFDKLVRMMAQSGDVTSFSDQQCAEAVALSRSAQQQLQGVMQSCQNRLRKLDPSGPLTAGADGPSNFVPSTQDRPMKKQTLGMQLEKVQEESADCVFIARKISCMGFQSQDMLAAHYSKYGIVSKVFIAHSRVKPTHGQPRIRPGSLGFVVMACAKSVQAILGEGKEQTVAGHRIWVEPFEKAARVSAGQEKSTDVASTNTGGTPASSSFTDSVRSSSGSGSAGGSEKSSEKLEEKDSTDSQNADKSDPGSGSGTENGGAVDNGAGSENGLASENGGASQNGVASENGLASENGMASENGVGSENGVSSENGVAAENTEAAEDVKPLPGEA